MRQPLLSKYYGLGVLALALANSAPAQPPELLRVEPAGGCRGQELKLTLRGDRLGRARGLLFYEPGVTLLGLRAVDEETLEATLRFADDCPLGQHPLRVVGPTGVSEAAAVFVGPFESLSEDPNSTNKSGQMISAERFASGVTIDGVVNTADVDAYRVRLQQGQRLSAEVEAVRLGGAFLDAYLDVVGPDGAVLASSDDSDLLRQDPLLSIVAATTGEYTVRVREAAFGGDFESRYRLHLGPFPRPLVGYPAGGPADESFQVRLIGDPAGDLTLSIDPSAAPGMIQARAPAPVTTPSPIPIRIADLPNLLEQEPNDSPSAATPSGTTAVAMNGILSSAGDVDYFRFPARRGERLRFELYGARIGSPIDSVVTLLGPDGRVLAFNDDGVVHDSSMRLTAPVTGDYVVRVEDHRGRGGGAFAYRLEIDRARPGLLLTSPRLSPIAPQRGQTISTPRGGRVVHLVSVRRQGVEGPVRLEVSGTPKGVSFTAALVKADEHVGVVVFEAEQDAPLGASLVQVKGVVETASGQVTGLLEEALPLVLGEPRQTVYHSVRVDSVPLVVTEPAPFEIEVTEPTIPVSRDGRLDVRCRVARARGFAEDILLDAPRLPAWIERSEDDIEVASAESEKVFPLIVRSRASQGPAQVVITAEARVGGAVVKIASRPISLAIADPLAEATIESTAAGQGASAEVACRLAWNRAAAGELRARLGGLPTGVRCPTLTVQPGQELLKFPINVGREAPVALHNTLWLEIASSRGGDTATDFMGRGGVLEVLPVGGAATETTPRLEVLRRKHSSLPGSRLIP